ncbi:MAG: hypothetical protein K2N74_00435, partial [Clostridiales bacterium]|nr:hypothetical protein [Clostridiales bacterium]
VPPQSSPAAHPPADTAPTHPAPGGGINSVASTYAAASDLNYDSTNKLHYFKDKATYWYIDYTNGVKFANGDKTIATDIVEITVDGGALKGKKDNPWVINDKADWDGFVDYVATTKGT